MDKIGRGALQMAPEMRPGYNIFMKRYLGAIFVISVTIGGCAAQHHPASSSSATNPTPSVSEHKSSGWYLMQPPVHHRNLDTAARLANWEVLAYFEHASQSDAARERGLSAYASYLPVSGSGAMDSVQLSQRLASSTLCVAADDPRINWFHSASLRESVVNIFEEIGD